LTANAWPTPDGGARLTRAKLQPILSTPLQFVRPYWRLEGHHDVVLGSSIASRAFPTGSPRGRRRTLNGVGPRIAKHTITDVWMSPFASCEDLELKP